MMISEKMQSTLNDQINEELFSSYLYLSMSAWFQSINYKGFAGWMKKQSTEEYEHAMKIYDYLHEVGADVSLDAIKKPQASWKSPLDAFKDALKHEKHITECINKLADLAVEEKDHATNIFLHWFVTEQVEEVGNATDIVEKLKMIGDNPAGLFMLDGQLGHR